MRESRVPIAVVALKTFPSLNKLDKKSKPEKTEIQQGITGRMIHVLKLLSHNFSKQPSVSEKLLLLTRKILTAWRTLVDALVAEIDKGSVSSRIEEEGGLYASYDIYANHNGTIEFDCDLGIKIGGIEHSKFTKGGGTK